MTPISTYAIFFIRSLTILYLTDTAFPHRWSVPPVAAPVTVFFQPSGGIHMNNCNMNETVNPATIHWTLTKDGILTITGSGKIPDSNCGTKPPAPWAEQQAEIRNLIIKEGITEIGVNDFRDCINLSEAVLPKGLKRIGAYAFQGCTKLKQITSVPDSFRHILEPEAVKVIRPSFRNEQTTPSSILFGADSFRSVPWAIERWGNFYSKDGILYACFSDEKKLTIPMGIHTLKALSFAKKDLLRIQLPQSLRVIEGTAFAESSFRYALNLPADIEKVDPDAFVGCNLKRINFPVSWPVRKPRLNQYNGKLSRRKPSSAPEWINRYSLSSEPVWEHTPYRRLKITENKEIHHQNGTITRVRDSKQINVGDRILQRLHFGMYVIGIRWSKEHLEVVKSLRWNSDYGCVELYEVYPIQEMHSNSLLLVPWTEEFRDLDEYDATEDFGVDGEQMMKTASLVDVSPAFREEWFVCQKNGDFGGPVELDLAQRWMADHPEIHPWTEDHYLK